MNFAFNPVYLCISKKTGRLFYYFILIILVQLLLTFTGCGGGGDSSSDSDTPPSGLTYSSTSAVYTKNLIINDNIPAYTGTAVEWSVTPSLPAGLVIDQSTGIISGTPSTDQAAAEYKVTASNSSGSATAVISIAVKDVPPAALEYSVISAVYTIGLEITNEPSYYGTVTSWSITPDLPEGLILDTATGVITGTPQAEQSAKYYTVTASNPEGSTSAAISITVNDVPPSALEYLPVSSVYIKDHSITEHTLSYSGTVESWSVNPDLPEGLTLDPVTGKIKGTPLSEQTASDYTITASNKYGSTNAVITIAVNDVAPSALSYSLSPAVYTIDEVMAANTPSVIGTVTSWSVTPALPRGLTLNTATGVITGIPEETAAATDYTITASNNYGSVSVLLTITVNEKAPADLTYADNPAVYTKGLRIGENLPSLKGSAASWSVTPELPQGLILNTTTGVISGTPEVVQVEKSYTITASNSMGSTSKTISIKVNHAAPTGLVYTPSTVTLGRWLYFGSIFRWIYFPTAISLIPACNGTVTSWSIDKALPSGVTLNTSTGVISGTGTIGSNTFYTITAGNSGGTVTARILIKRDTK